MSHDYDPAKQPCEPTWRACEPGCAGCPSCYGSGPAGRTTNIEHNEKGILETGLFQVIALHQNSYMSSNHDSQRMGVYRTNSVGDND